MGRDRYLTREIVFGLTPKIGKDLADSSVGFSPPNFRNLMRRKQSSSPRHVWLFRGFKTSLTYYTKALELQPDHKAAREYLGELYVETGNMEKAKEELAILAKLCPGGCEEREDLQKAISAKSASN